MPATPAWLAALESLLNRHIDASSAARALAVKLAGTALCIEVTGMTRVRAGIDHGRLMLAAAEAADPTPDATIRGTPLTLLQLARGGGGGGTAAQISGNAEVAAAYRALFAAASPDLEEELSRLVGDLAARRLAGLARGGLRWLRHAGRTAGDNLVEYLQEESRDLVGKTELQEFLRGVDAAREAADRIAARLERLERRRGAAR